MVMLQQRNVSPRVRAKASLAFGVVRGRRGPLTRLRRSPAFGGTALARDSRLERERGRLRKRRPDDGLHVMSERTDKMLANYKLYWDPKSNLLFIPGFETEADGETQPRGFAVERFRPCGFITEKGYSYPSFEAVYITCFGTWGLLGYPRSHILRDLISSKGPGFTDQDVRANFRKFVEDRPEFRNTRFAAKEDCLGSIPKEAIYVPEA